MANAARTVHKRWRAHGVQNGSQTQGAGAASHATSEQRHARVRGRRRERERLMCPERAFRCRSLRRSRLVPPTQWAYRDRWAYRGRSAYRDQWAEQDRSAVRDRRGYRGRRAVPGLLLRGCRGWRRSIPNRQTNRYRFRCRSSPRNPNSPTNQTNWSHRWNPCHPHSGRRSGSPRAA